MQCLHADVVSLERVTDGFRIYSHGGSFIAARVVLAPGALPPQPMSADAVWSPARTTSPPVQRWRAERIRPQARVLVVGTGLTLLMAISLRRRGYRGRIDVSRHAWRRRRAAPVPR